MAQPMPDEATIFNVARHIQAPDARRLYLQQAVGDDQHRLGRLEALLRAHEEEMSFLEVPAVPPCDSSAAVAGNGPSRQIGPYKLLEQIGEGGFGVIFMAEKQQPIRRAVALKILKPGMD